jgi:hypothetical protein
MIDNPNETIRTLVEGWCDCREYYALSKVLPSWHGNNGLTDGWEFLRDALRHAYEMCTHLPQSERDALKKCYVDIDAALRNRS